MALGNTLLAAVLTIFAGCIFFSTKHPSLGDGDNPELVFRSKLFVPAHPPGYPLLMLIGKGADLAVSGLYGVLPFLTPPSVFCVYNTLAVVFTALTVGILFLASRNLGLTAGASTATSFLFVFAPNVRNYANQFEVFSLNNLLMALLIWVATKFECAMSEEEDNTNSSKIYSERRRCVCLGAFVSGLAMSNQHTSILFILPLAVWVIIRWPRGAVSCTPLILLSIVAGLLPYAALPLSMEQSDPRWLFTAWGATDTWQGLVGHFLRSDYGTFSLSPKPLEGSLWSNSYRNWQLYGKELRLQTLWILWLLAPLGLLWGVSTGTPPGAANATTAHNNNKSNDDYAHKKDDDVNDASKKKKGGGDKTAKKKPRSAPANKADTHRCVSASIWWALTGALAFYLLVLNTLSNLDPANPVNLEVQRRFWFQPLLVVVLLIGRALSGISDIFRQTDSMFDLTDLTVGMLIALTQILFNWTDFSDAFVMEDFSRAIINSLPHGAILVADGDAPFFGTSAVAYALAERLDLLIISSPFLMSPFFQRNYEKSTGMKLPGERYGYGPKPLFNNADLLNTWIHHDKKRVFFIASQFTHPDDQSHAEHFAVRNMGVVNEFIPMSLFEEIGEAAMSEPLANAVKDWDLKKGAMGSYVEELLYALPLELPNSFNGSHNVMPLETNGTANNLNLTQPAIMYDIHTWESEILRNFKSLMSVNVEQLLAFASHDDVRARDVALSQEVADIVAGNTSVASFLRRSKQQDRQPRSSSILFSTPMRYQMLVVARALLQNNRLVAAKVLLPAPTAPSVDDLLMFRVMQQLMRFHLCTENGHPPLALFDETASIASTVLEAAKTFGVEDTEYFSRRDVLDYMVWLKRRVTRHNPEC